MKTSNSRRSVRMADLIMRRLAEMLVEEIQDPRLEMVTISGVRLNKDLRIAEVRYTLSGDQERVRQAQQALEAASGFLRSGLRNLGFKFLPQLRFQHDDYLEDMIYAGPGPDPSRNS